MRKLKQYAAILMLTSFILGVVSPEMAAAAASVVVKTDDSGDAGSDNRGVLIYADGLTTKPQAGFYAYAMGLTAKAFGRYSFAMGYDTTTGVAGDDTFGHGAVSMGYATNAKGNSAVSLGYKSYAEGDGSFAGGGYIIKGGATVNGGKAYGRSSFAFGEGAIAGTSGSADATAGTIALGNGALAKGANTIALGNNANTSTFTNSVALGAGSTVTANDTIAVGSTTKQRKITGLADGSIAAGSHEAVTGNQLNATNVNVATNTANITALKGNFETDGTTAKIATKAAQDASGNVITTTYATKSELTTHTGNNDIHVTAAQKTAWDAKQNALTTEQLAAVNSGIDTTKVAQIGTNATDITALKGNFEADGTTAKIATKAAQDANGNVIADTYATKTALNDYAKTTDVASTYLAKTEAESTYATKTALNDYAKSADVASTYATKTALGELNSTVSGHTTEIGNLQTAIAAKANADEVYTKTETYNRTQIDSMIGSGGKRGVAYTDDTFAEIKLAGTEGTKISSLKAGEISETSTEAVNGAQLHETNANVAANTAGIGMINAAIADYSDVKANVASIKEGITVGTGDYWYISSGANAAANLIALDSAVKQAGTGNITGFETAANGLVTAKKADNTTLNVAQLKDHTIDSGSYNVETGKLTLNSKDSYSGNIESKDIDLSGIKTEITIENPDGKKIIFANGKNVNVTQDTSVTDTITFRVGTVENPTFSEAVTVAPDSANKTTISGTGITVGTSSLNSEKLIVGNSSLTGSALQIGGTTYISETGLNAGGQKITGVADGTIDSDAVNYGQIIKSATYDGTTLLLKNYKGDTIASAAISGGSGGGDGSGAIAGGTIPDGASVAKANENGTAVASGYNSQANAANSVANGFGAGVSANSTAGIAIGKGATVGYKDGNTSGEDTAAINGIAIGENSRVEGANSIAVGTGHVITGKNSGAFGDPTIINGDNSYAIGNNNTIEDNNNFVLGNNVKLGKGVKNTVAFGSLDPEKEMTVTESNTVAVGGRTISGLADGTSPTDAATVRQVDAVRNQLGSVSNEVREVGAISAALAGLHFAEPSGEEGDKLVGAVAYGGYRGSSAEAIGLAYKPSPNMMLSASTSISNGNDSQNAYNVGFSLKFGKGETAKTKAELQKQVKYLNEKNSTLESTVAQQGNTIVQQGAEIQTLRSELEELKKLIKK